jgi:YfiH family protein
MEVFKKSFPEGDFLTFNQQVDLPFYRVQQVHGTKIIHFDEETRSADGLIALKETLGIYTADCLPVLLIGKTGHALIHAGWRGLKEGILQQKKLLSLKAYHAFIGPHIKKCCYQVGEEFLEKFPPEFFERKAKKLYFSLEEVAFYHLKHFLKIRTIELGTLCTHCQSELHSYRRNQTSKRNLNIWRPALFKN